jgi:hypothetical protein
MRKRERRCAVRRVALFTALGERGGDAARLQKLNQCEYSSEKVERELGYM